MAVYTPKRDPTKKNYNLSPQRRDEIAREYQRMLDSGALELKKADPPQVVLPQPRPVGPNINPYIRDWVPGLGPIVDPNLAPPKYLEASYSPDTRAKQPWDRANDMGARLPPLGVGGGGMLHHQGGFNDRPDGAWDRTWGVADLSGSGGSDVLRGGSSGASSRPFRTSGKVRIGDQEFDFASGGRTGPGRRGSTPYGVYSLDPMTVGPKTGEHFAMAGAGNVPDPKYPGVPRSALFIHSYADPKATIDKVISAGCLAIPKSQWPAAKAAILAAQKQFGDVVLEVTPQGAQVLPAKGYAGKFTPLPDDFIAQADQISGAGDIKAQQAAMNIPPDGDPETLGAPTQGADLYGNPPGGWYKPENHSAYQALADAAADKYGIPHEVMNALVYKESQWQPGLTSPKGAVGIAQVLPSTAGLTAAQLKDPATSLDAGAKYLAEQYQHFGDWPTALAAYNGGPGGTRAGASYANDVMALVAKGSGAYGGGPTPYMYGSGDLPVAQADPGAPAQVDQSAASPSMYSANPAWMTGADTGVPTPAMAGAPVALDYAALGGGDATLSPSFNDTSAPAQYDTTPVTGFDQPVSPFITGVEAANMLAGDDAPAVAPGGASLAPAVSASLFGAPAATPVPASPYVSQPSVYTPTPVAATPIQPYSTQAPSPAAGAAAASGMQGYTPPTAAGAPSDLQPFQLPIAPSDTSPYAPGDSGDPAANAAAGKAAIPQPAIAKPGYFTTLKTGLQHLIAPIVHAVVPNSVNLAGLSGITGFGGGPLPSGVTDRSSGAAWLGTQAWHMPSLTMADGSINPSGGSSYNYFSPSSPGGIGGYVSHTGQLFTYPTDPDIYHSVAS